MSPAEALAALEESASLGAVAPFWDGSEAFSASPDGMDSLLSPARIAENAAYCGLEAGMLEALLPLAAKIGKSPPLSRLLCHLFFCNFLKPGAALQSPESWPSFKRSLGDDGAGLYLLAALGYAPLLKAQHRRQGVPEDVSRDTARQVACYAGNYAKGSKGRLGLYPGQLFWMRNYLWDNLYLRLGRFEYWPKPYPYFDMALRGKDGAKLVCLARPGLKIAADGYALDDLAGPPDVAWTTSLSIDGESVCGHPVGADGRPSRELATLPLKSWDVVLKNGSLVLDMHIPSGGGMSIEECRDSFRKAKAFFGERFPELKPSAIVCVSWTFNPNLPEILPASSNLVKLLKEVHLFPVASRPSDGLWFLFLMDKFDLATAPRETSLQRAVLDYISSGRRWRTGGMLLALDEIK